ncbi:hypothetical protein [Mesobacterium pallidum]|uniref:hypothetical protein n=1 Tax=Mesobacterium pallidum TaxID=2872037 RepID=UPI001EE1978F|nr:hypothetical protein [Mesobacterium pallidum]
MSEIEELERRISAAMDRIARGIEAIEPAEPAAPAADPQDLDDLRTALEEERLANAQLESRLNAIHGRHATEKAALQLQATEARGALAALEVEMQRLRRINAQLAENNAALRAANEAGVGEPHLINTGMRTELESLRAARSADRAETQAILDVLTPMVEAATAENEETA